MDDLEKGEHVKDVYAHFGLAHGYFRDRAAEFMTKDGRDSMIAELEEAQSLFRRADSELEIAIKPLRKRYGHTEEKLKHDYDEYLKEIGVMPS